MHVSSHNGNDVHASQRVTFTVCVSPRKRVGPTKCRRRKMTMTTKLQFPGQKAWDYACVSSSKIYKRTKRPTIERKTQKNIPLNNAFEWNEGVTQRCDDVLKEKHIRKGNVLWWVLRWANVRPGYLSYQFTNEMIKVIETFSYRVCNSYHTFFLSSSYVNQALLFP